MTIRLAMLVMGIVLSGCATVTENLSILVEWNGKRNDLKAFKDPVEAPVRGQQCAC
jgi:hypothetical protein